MNKNISFAFIAFIALLAFTGVTASAQTGAITGVDASVGTTSISGVVTTGTDTPGVTEKRQHGALPIRSEARLEMDGKRIKMEAREGEMRTGTTTPRQTQGATFGEKARGTIGDPDFDLRNKARVDMRLELKDDRIKMEMRTKELRASTTEMQNKIKDKAQKKRLEQARHQVEVVDMRIGKAIERVQKLHDRVLERLNKIEAAGVDVSASRGHLALAKAKIEEATTKAAGVKLAIETAFASITAVASTSTAPGTTAQNAMKAVQEAVREVSKTLQEAHHHVVLAVSTLKPSNSGPGSINSGRKATSSTVVPASATTTATSTQ